MTGKAFIAIRVFYRGEILPKKASQKWNFFLHFELAILGQYLKKTDLVITSDVPYTAAIIIWQMPICATYKGNFSVLIYANI